MLCTVKSNIGFVVASVTGKIKEFMDVNNHDMGEDIFLGELIKEISMLDGVVSLIELRAYKINGGTYSSDICPLPTMSETGCTVCEPGSETIFKPNGTGATAQRIDLLSSDMVLMGDKNAMYEVRYPETDIDVRFKTV